MQKNLNENLYKKAIPNIRLPGKKYPSTIKSTFLENVFNVFNNFAILLMCALMLYPFLYEMAISLSDKDMVERGGISIFPKMFTLQNYSVVVSNPSIWNGMIISVLRVVLGTVISLGLTTIAAYVLSKKGIPGRKQITLFLMIPTFINAGIMPSYILYSKIHLLDNFLVYIIPYAFVFYNMLIIREYLKTIPSSLEESAFIDGANEFQVLWRIYFPLAKPVMATVALWIAVGQWNDWTTSLYFVTNRKLFPIQYLLMKLIKEYDAMQQMIAEMTMKGQTVDTTRYIPSAETVRAATLMVATIPIICVYPFLQKYFVSGITLGSVKE